MLCEYCENQSNQTLIGNSKRKRKLECDVIYENKKLKLSHNLPRQKLKGRLKKRPVTIQSTYRKHYDENYIITNDESVDLSNESAFLRNLAKRQCGQSNCDSKIDSPLMCNDGNWHKYSPPWKPIKMTEYSYENLVDCNRSIHPSVVPSCYDQEKCVKYNHEVSKYDSYVYNNHNYSGGRYLSDLERDFCFNQQINNSNSNSQMRNANDEIDLLQFPAKRRCVRTNSRELLGNKDPINSISRSSLGEFTKEMKKTTNNFECLPKICEQNLPTVTSNTSMYSCLSESPSFTMVTARETVNKPVLDDSPKRCQCTVPKSKSKQCTKTEIRAKSIPVYKLKICTGRNPVNVNNTVQRSHSSLDNRSTRSNLNWERIQKEWIHELTESFINVMPPPPRPIRRKRKNTGDDSEPHHSCPKHRKLSSEKKTMPKERKKTCKTKTNSCSKHCCDQSRYSYHELDCKSAGNSCSKPHCEHQTCQILKKVVSFFSTPSSVQILPSISVYGLKHCKNNLPFLRSDSKLLIPDVKNSKSKSCERKCSNQTITEPNYCLANNKRSSSMCSSSCGEAKKSLNHENGSRSKCLKPTSNDFAIASHHMQAKNIFLCNYGGPDGGLLLNSKNTFNLTNNNNLAQNVWNDMFPIHKIPYYWLSFSHTYINKDPIENFYHYYINIYNDVPKVKILRIWYQLEYWEKLPFIIEAFIATLPDFSSQLDELQIKKFFVKARSTYSK